jgi:hypothetical protein
MQPGVLRCNGAPGEGIPLQQARARGQEMVMLYRLFRGNMRCTCISFPSLAWSSVRAYRPYQAINPSLGFKIPLVQ